MRQIIATARTPLIATVITVPFERDLDSFSSPDPAEKGNQIIDIRAICN